MIQPTAEPGAPPQGRAAPKPKRLPLTASELPPLMSVPVSVDRSPFRAPLLQFIWDWNVTVDRAAMIAEAPFYRGNDWLLLPAIAVVVHALAERDGVALPDWVLGRRSPQDAMLFPRKFDGAYARWVRERSPDVCAYHRVWFHPRMLDKGTPDWWLPWD